MLVRVRDAASACVHATAKCSSLAPAVSHGIRRGSSRWTSTRQNLERYRKRAESRNFHTVSRLRDADSARDVIERFKHTLDFPPATSTFERLSHEDVETLVNTPVTLHGYLGSRRDASKTLTFAELHDMQLQATIQIVSAKKRDDEESEKLHQQLRMLEEHTPIAISGTVQARKAPKSSSPSQTTTASSVIPSVEVKLDRITILNTFPSSIIMASDTQFPPESRHLQLRNDATLRQALSFRSRAAQLVRDELCQHQTPAFIEIETPLLFKSTPEGAREFLVPTRHSPGGRAYALPQSPQQYKQILMASGIPRYMQIAKCFRDEDLRADRQPEFTQVDLEMGFATGAEVMGVVEKLVKRLWREMLGVEIAEPFGCLSYEQAMGRFGSDKPDLRFGSEIRRIEYMLPMDLVGKIGPLHDPIVEVMKLAISDDPNETRRFVNEFMDAPEAMPFVQNPDGQPGIFIIDSRRPLQGLQPFGFEAAEQADEMLKLSDGDLVVLQARPRKPFSGGSTPIGNLRLALHRFAVQQNLQPAPTGFAFTWINDFPLFSPASDTEPGQGGAAGISATHHPFTAPKLPADVDLLLTDPLRAVADHYDLVVNGVELGGGSRRIHLAEMQELVMRDVLQMSAERVADFAHLLQVLRAGCPPHAGMALGFDRLVAVMLGRESVREVIAFPKSGRGEDGLVGSPSVMTAKQLETYHLKVR